MVKSQNTFRKVNVLSLSLSLCKEICPYHRVKMDWFYYQIYCPRSFEIYTCPA